MQERARGSKRGDMKLFRQLVYRQTDKETDGRTLLVPKVAIATEKHLMLLRTATPWTNVQILLQQNWPYWQMQDLMAMV